MDITIPYQDDSYYIECAELGFSYSLYCDFLKSLPVITFIPVSRWVYLTKETIGE